MLLPSQKIDPKKVPIVFFGTSSFARTHLKALITRKFHVVGVVTRADKRQGRKKEVLPSSVKQFAEQKKISILQPNKLDESVVAKINALGADLFVVASYGRILPKRILEMPKFGCLNVHASLLPQYRGASPVQNALLSGETKTGITIMRMDEGMDTGPILNMARTTVKRDETLPELTDRLAFLGAELLIETLPKWIHKKITAKPQNNKQATYCQLIEKEDGRVFWNKTTTEIYNMYRAFFPWPGIFCYFAHKDSLKRIRLLRIRPGKIPRSSRRMGEVYAEGSGIFVKTADASIQLDEVQIEGKKPLDTIEFVRGYEAFLGSMLQ